jgi:hypothetical protein
MDRVRIILRESLEPMAAMKQMPSEMFRETRLWREFAPEFGVDWS